MRKRLEGERSSREELGILPTWDEFARRVRPEDCGSVHKENWAGNRPERADDDMVRPGQKDKRVCADYSWLPRLRPCSQQPASASKDFPVHRMGVSVRQPQPCSPKMRKDPRRMKGVDGRAVPFRAKATVPVARMAAGKDDHLDRPSLVSSTLLCDFETKPVKAMKERQMCF